MKSLYIVSFGVHAALAIGILAIKGPKIYEDVSVAVFEAAKKEPPKPPPPPPPEPEAPKETKAKVAARAAPKPEAAPPPEAASPGPDIPDLGFALGPGDGAGAGGGLAVPTGPRTNAAPSASVQTTRKVLAAAPKPADECTEAPVKPKVRSLSQPSYTADAREAGVSGKVRVELTVDATGHVSNARVLEGLGHGLDEAALASARAATFEPGTRCGKPAVTTFVIAMRFAL